MSETSPRYLSAVSSGLSWDPPMSSRNSSAFGRRSRWLPRIRLRGGVGRRRLGGRGVVGLTGFDLPGGVVGGVLGDGAIVVIVVVERAFDVGLDALLEPAELAIAAPDLPAELGQLARAEDHQRHDEHHEDLERADLRQSSSFRAVFPKAMVVVRGAKTASGGMPRHGGSVSAARPAMMRAPVRPI